MVWEIKSLLAHLAKIFMFRFCYRVEEDQIHILDFKSDDEYQIFRFVFVMPNLKPNSCFFIVFFPGSRLFL